MADLLFFCVWIELLLLAWSNSKPVKQKVSISVTRFGEIPPIWYNFKSLGLNLKFEGLFSIWLNVDPTEAKMFYHWASFHCCRWPNTLK